MKHGVLLFSSALMLLVGSTFAADESFFELSQEKIKEAVEYGTTTDYAINEFGGYDIELNKFALGDKIGYFDILTPYRRIVGASLTMKQAGKKLSFEEAKRRSKKPVELRVFLYVRKEDLKDPIRCLVKTSKESLDISGMVMEFSMCDDKSGECVRSLAYLFPVIDLQKERSFQIILSGEKLGEKTVEIKTNQIK